MVQICPTDMEGMDTQQQSLEALSRCADQFGDVGGFGMMRGQDDHLQTLLYALALGWNGGVGEPEPAASGLPGTQVMATKGMTD
jgi:hypothetical protein